MFNFIRKKVSPGTNKDLSKSPNNEAIFLPKKLSLNGLM